MDSAVSYVRAEVFFAARAHASGLRAPERAIDACPPPVGHEAIAAREALHMRAAVVAGRAGRHDAADEHLDEAWAMGDRVPDSVYRGTAFEPGSVRIHEVSVAVSLGNEHVQHCGDMYKYHCTCARTTWTSRSKRIAQMPDHGARLPRTSSPWPAATSEAVDMAELAERAVGAGWGAKLTAALSGLGLSPLQDVRCWLLLSCG
ncbi:hypothetical protein NRF20_44940 [Streptomyces sp. R-74717]|uniref:hypothetical protein n=1 Tax=Streptomyces TaxID=1883 RepID=UPI0037BB1B32